MNVRESARGDRPDASPGEAVSTLRSPPRGKSMHVDSIPEIGTLSTAEKILLVEDLWDSIAADAEPLPVPQSHLDELEMRIPPETDQRFRLMPIS